MVKVYATVKALKNLVVSIPFKGVEVKVEFTGGNPIKEIPAKLYTLDPFIQSALDSSDQLGRLYYDTGIGKAGGSDGSGTQPDSSPVLTPAPNSVGSEEIKDQSIRREDLSSDVQEGLDELNNISLTDEDLLSEFGYKPGDVDLDDM